MAGDGTITAAAEDTPEEVTVAAVTAVAAVILGHDADGTGALGRDDTVVDDADRDARVVAAKTTAAAAAEQAAVTAVATVTCKGARDDAHGAGSRRPDRRIVRDRDITAGGAALGAVTTAKNSVAAVAAVAATRLGDEAMCVGARR